VKHNDNFYSCGGRKAHLPIFRSALSADRFESEPVTAKKQDGEDPFLEVSMVFWGVLPKSKSFCSSVLVSSGALLLIASAGYAQSTSPSSGRVGDGSQESSFFSSSSSAFLAGGVSLAQEGDAKPAVGNDPSAAEPGKGHAVRHYPVEPAQIWAQPSFSRVGISADISPLGVGIKGAIVLTHYVDGRLMGDFFKYNGNRIEIEGFNVYPTVHMASMAAALDWYPFGSVWRISPGVMFYNGNQFSMKADLAPGAEVDLGSSSFYAADPTKLPGSTALNISGVLGLHSHSVDMTLTTGFGRFIPRSNRHWSYPSEFGVVFMGAPSIDIQTSGWACTSSTLIPSTCGDVTSSANAVGAGFQSALQTKLVSWRKSLSEVTVYPIISSGVSYSFNIR
jgi:hypothetical protein